MTKQFLRGLSLSVAALLSEAPLRATHDPVLGHHALFGPVALLWESRLNGPLSGPDAPRALAVSPDGTRIFVTGSGFNPGPFLLDSNYLTAAYDTASGAQQWLAVFNGSFLPVSYDDAAALGVSPDGMRVFVTGTSLGFVGVGTEQDFATLAYDASTGVQQWVAGFNGPLPGSSERAMALGVSPDGTQVFVTGSSVGAGTFDDYATVAYNAVTGAPLWEARFNGPADFVDVPRALRVSPDGTRVFVSGFSGGVGTAFDYATVAYDAVTGVQLWEARVNGPLSEDDEPFGLGVSPDGTKVFVTGRSPGSGTNMDAVTVAYDAATGAELWVDRFDGPLSGYDEALALGVSPDGTRVLVAGGSDRGPTGFDYTTIAYDAITGARQWVAHFNGPVGMGDGAVALSVGPDGARVVVTGSSEGSGTGVDYATVAYEIATGALLWVARFDGSATLRDDPFAVGMSPDGTRVFVTGSSQGLGTDFDYASLGYLQFVDPATQLSALILTVEGTTAPIGVKDALIALLALAYEEVKPETAAASDGSTTQQDTTHEHNTKTCALLQAFIGMVNGLSGILISEADARLLIATAEHIQSQLCP